MTTKPKKATAKPAALKPEPKAAPKPKEPKQVGWANGKPRYEDA